MAKLNGSDALTTTPTVASTMIGVRINDSGAGTAEGLVDILRQLGHVRLHWSEYDPTNATTVEAIRIDLPGGGIFVIQLV